ncbi:hypothetical protein [Poseidonocella sp. HB161398]|uniref:hypothetical protein n=1 Tax=Poseidonocella sp. HB161398 TaxID=2320855 RepID=UPI0011092E54|nr:hypothetical protein [Poseidonocella sp. HB161398]
MEDRIIAARSVFLTAAFGFATVSPIQKLVMDRASAAGASAFAASVSIWMVKLRKGNGARTDGATIAAGYGLASPNWAGALLSTAALLLAVNAIRTPSQASDALAHAA